MTNTQRNFLKWGALFMMLLDHIGVIFSDRLGILEWLRVVGRFAFPLFGFLIAFNFARRELSLLQLQRYLFKLGGFGLLAQGAYYFLFPGSGLNIYAQFIGGILTIFALSHLIHIRSISSQWKRMTFAIPYLILGGFGGMLSFYSDYHLGGLFYCLACYVFVRYLTITKTYRHLWFLVLAGLALFANKEMMAMYGHTIIGAPMMLAIVMTVYLIIYPPPMHYIPACFNLEDRKPSKQQTYFFYAFYPVHLWVLLGILVLLNHM